jgi:two-component system, OmpR family, response regulator
MRVHVIDKGSSVMKMILLSQDQKLVDRFSLVLSLHNFIVDAVGTPEVFENYLDSVPYDLMILDASTPNLDILPYAKKLQSVEDPLMLLLLFENMDEKLEIDGFNSGADACLLRGSSDNLLTASVCSLLRRRGKKYPIVGRWGEFIFDCSNQTASYMGQLIPFTPKEYHILTIFLTSPNQTFSSQVLIDKAWISSLEPPSVETVKIHIRSVRAKLKKVGLDGLIQTLHGFGYRLNYKLLSDMVAVTDS